MTDAVLPNASSYLQLYSSDNARPSRQFQIEAKEDYVTFADSKADRPWKMKASAWKFQDAAGLNEFDLRVKIDAGDSERAANAAAAGVADGKAVAEAVRAQAAEAANAAAIAAEIARAGIAEAANAAAVVSEAARAGAAESALDVAYKAADVVINAAIASEEAARIQACAANALSITNLIGASPGNLDSLTELVTAYTNMDGDQQDLIVALAADVAEMRAELDQLLNIS